MAEDRLTWDDCWYQVARVVAQRSDCTRARCGAVVVDTRQRIVATGYNGPPAGLARWWEDEPANWILLPDGSATCATACPRGRGDPPSATYDNCVAVHAEANAIAFCDRREREGGTLYVTRSPCFTCAKLVANSGISRVVVGWNDDRDNHLMPERTRTFLRASGVHVDLKE